MELQQIGKIETPSGTADALMFIDADRPNEAMIHLWSKTIKPSALLVDIVSKNGGYEFVAKSLYATRENGALFLPQLDNNDFDLVKNTKAQLKFNGSELEGDWSGPKGNKGTLKFSGFSRSAEKKRYKVCKTWDEFKAWTADVRNDAMLFRGHGSDKFLLQTTLHRSGRNRLERYCSQELLDFHNHAEIVLGKNFNLDDGRDYATLLGLAQHHGVPTPLLDWTASPYIAAFFAFSSAMEEKTDGSNSDFIRVFALTRNFIEKFSTASVTISHYGPYIRPLSISPRYNPRLYAQQGQFLVTNVADIEGWIDFLEDADNQKYLIGIDVPRACAADALDDLNFMGLTAATMFPGLDGVGKMIRHKILAKLPQKKHV
jgi:FRG domain